MQDRIEVRGLRVDGVHGVLEEEQHPAPALRGRPRPYLDTGPGAASDDLAATADYGAAVDAGGGGHRGPPHRLLESLAGAIAELVLDDARVEAVTVVVRKLAPAVGAAGDLDRGARHPHRRRVSWCGPFWASAPTSATAEAELARAVAGLPDVVAVSQLYETEPVGGPAGQGRYLNVVVELDTELDPRQLLEVARRLEDGGPTAAHGALRPPHPRRRRPARGGRGGGRRGPGRPPSPHVGATVRGRAARRTGSRARRRPAPGKGLVEWSRWWVDWRGTDPIAWSDRHPP